MFYMELRDVMTNIKTKDLTIISTILIRCSLKSKHTLVIKSSPHQSEKM